MSENGWRYLYNYYLGLDLGQAKDYTALCIVEEPVWIPSGVLADHDWAGKANITEAGWISPSDLTPWQCVTAMKANYLQGRPPDPPLQVRHLARFPLGTRYPDVVDSVASLMRTEPLKSRWDVLCVDYTGVGIAVVDDLVKAGLAPVAINIHGGNNVTVHSRSSAGGDVRLGAPKRELVGAAQVLLQGGRLRIAKGLKEAETLRQELLNFRIKIDPRTAHDSYSHWREGDHDDLVFAVALAVWYRQWRNKHIDTACARRGALVPM